jgi:penicillin-binding protein 2
MIHSKRHSLVASFWAVVLSVAVFSAPCLTDASTGTLKAKTATAIRRRHIVTGVPTFADSAKDDDATFDDPIVRQAAVAGLGRYNGAVVALDPNTGRILSVVNQKLAFSQGFIPCSTIKPVIAVAALEENVINRDSMIKVAPRRYLNLVEALAHSNNAFFEELGRRMGFDTVSHYARLLGLGELSGYNLPLEQPGALPLEPPKNGGVARMSSFGEGIQITPLQLASLVSTLANGGTIYYLQYPHTQAEVDSFKPRIKRTLDIAALLPDIRDGMLAAVLYGTARRSYTAEGEQFLGKTGTCSDSQSRVGWFVSYADQAHPKIVLAVLVRGHSMQITGPMASGIAGRIYRRLDEANYFADKLPKSTPSASVAPDTTTPQLTAVAQTTKPVGQTTSSPTGN